MRWSEEKRGSRSTKTIPFTPLRILKDKTRWENQRIKGNARADPGPEALSDKPTPEADCSPAREVSPLLTGERGPPSAGGHPCRLGSVAHVVNLSLLQLVNGLGVVVGGGGAQRIAENLELHLRDGGGIAADWGEEQAFISGGGGIAAD